MQVTGKLPVAITVLKNGEALKLKSVVMRSMSVGESLDAQAAVGAKDYVAVAEYAAMTKLVDDQGVEHAIDYATLRDTRKQNFDYLTGLKAELDEKEAAES